MNNLYKSAEGERQVMALYDTVLERWPVPYEGLTVGTRHGDAFVIASGDPASPPLVLLHGSCSNALAWMGDVAVYAAGLRVYAVDMPGEPGRSAPVRPDWNGPAYVEWLDDLLDGLGIRQAALLGISQGGWTALKYGIARPERVAKLVLLTPGGSSRPGLRSWCGPSRSRSWGGGAAKRSTGSRSAISRSTRTRWPS